jgi:predicted acylesterase/phospholipase RssA/CRP-like cAMP-binding protein
VNNWADHYLDLMSWMRQSPIFASFDDRGLERLRSVLRWRAFAGGEVLINEGDRSSCLTLIAAGLVEGFQTDRDGTVSVVGEAGPGRVLGIHALLGEGPTRTGIRAIRDGFYVEIDQSALEVFTSLHPRGSLATADLLLNQRQPEFRGRTVDRALTVALISLSGQTLLDRVSEPLAAALSKDLEIATLSRADLPTTREHLEVADARGEIDYGSCVPWLDSVEPEVDCVILRADLSDPPWALRCLRQADIVLLLGDTSQDPTVSEVERELFEMCDVRNQVDRILVLWFPDGTERHTRTLRWISSRPSFSHTSLRAGLYPEVERLASRLVSRSLAPKWLSESTLFRRFRTEQLRSIESHFSFLDLPGQHTLFHAGDHADALYVVVTGRLQAYRKDASGAETVLGEVGPGEVVGEMALLSGEGRTASVRAVRDSSLAVLSRSSFERLAETHPDLVLELARVVVSRGSDAPNRGIQTRAENFALIPLQQGLIAEAEAFAEGLAQIGSVALVDASLVERTLGNQVSTIQPGQPGEVVLVEWLNRLELEHDFVLYVADLSASAWTRRAVRQADQILLLDRASDGPDVSRLENVIFDEHGLGRLARKNLLLVQRADATSGSLTSNWIRDRSVDQWFHVRTDHPEDYARVARILTGRATGLVLGGGATRGIAHVGVYRALLEAKIPIDLLAGTSAGASVACLIAAQWSPNQIRDGMGAISGRVNRQILDLGPPLASVASGRRVRKELIQLFGEMRLEDQLLPCTVVTTDIARAESHLIRSGLMWHAVRASSSLPGAWPPVQDGDRLLVDGGVLNNLPTNQVLPAASRGRVIACQVSRDEADDYRGFDPYGSVISGWRTAARALLPGRKPHYPAMFDVISRCVTLGNVLNSPTDLRTSNELLHLSPPVAHFGMFSIRSPALVEEIIEVAYQHAMERLAVWCS